ncbi:MAG: TIGR02302 family protein [Pseudomonadota bacterium]
MGLYKGGGLRGAEARRVRRNLRLTRWSLWAETVARAFWPAFVVICAVGVMALFGWFAAFGPEVHRVLLGLGVAAMAAALIYGGTRIRRPDELSVRDRLDKGDRRRPLATLDDELAVGQGTAQTESVWRAHRLRAADAAAKLKAGLPEPNLAPRDRWALRLVAPVLLIAGLIAVGGDWAGRVAAITDPAPVAGAADPTASTRVAMAEAWATPPAYTGLSTIYLDAETASRTAAARPEDAPASEDADEAGAAPQGIRIPQGSEITIRVTDVDALPVMEGGEVIGLGEFQSLGGGLAEANGILSGSGTVTIRTSDDVLAAWPIDMIPDNAPEIELNGRPSVTVTRSLDVQFRASDDYGVAAAWAEIAPEGHDPENAKGLPLPVIKFGLPLPITGDTRVVEDGSIRDLTAHPWAGAEVDLVLQAEDGAAQVTATTPHRMVLPERRFSHPVARALVEQRRELALDYGQAGRVLDVLQAVMRRPHEIFDNSGAYLASRIAVRRLVGGIAEDDVAGVAPEVIEMLWLAALGLEDGDLSGALERLRQAQEALRQALENGSEEDIRRAMEDLRAALNEYLQQLAQQQQRNPQQQGQMDPSQQLSQQDLNEMLDRLQQQAESGLRDEARQMLSELNRMLENLQAAQQGQQQQGQGQQAMQELQEMIQRQRDLSDRTFDEMRQRRREQQLGQPSQQQGQQPGQQGRQQPGFGEGQGRGDEHGQQGQRQGEGRGEGQMPGQQPGPGGLASEQDALRQQLEQLGRGLGSEDAARALEEAARAMGEARDDLQQGAAGDAVRDQMEALDRLNEGAEALAQEMQNGQGETQAQGDRRGEGEGRDNSRNDPFDRPTSSFGALDGRSTRVPDQGLIDRARELMQELRRRAAEPARPQLELDYLDRLMERF